MIDTNIILASILGEPEKERLGELTLGEELVAPSVLPYEIGSAFSRMIIRSRLTLDQTLKGLEIYQSIPIRLVEVKMKDSLKIASDYGIYAYDAYYIETAKRLRIKLLTLDQSMARVAKDMGVTLMEV